MKTLYSLAGTMPRNLPRRLVRGWIGALGLLTLATLQTRAQVTITCPPTVNISCSTNPVPANTGTATATTSCGLPGVNVTYQDNTNMNGCMGTGTIQRTWTATDACGFSATCLQTIIVEDNTSPTISCPPFMVISCETDRSPATLGTASASDNCTPTNLILVTYTDNTAGLTGCNGTGTMTRNWQARDACGNIASCIQTIVIVDNTKPVLTLPPAVTVSCSANTTPAALGYATASDNCTPTGQLNVQFSDNVAGLTGCNGTGTIVRTWSAIDACNNVAFGTQLITLVDNTPPGITCPANLTISCEASSLPAHTGSATATDACGSVFIGYVDQANLACNQTGTIMRTWSAVDVCGNLNQCVQFITVIDQTAPVCTAPANITVDCAAGTAPAVTGSPVVSDNCTPLAALNVNFTDVELEPLGCNGTGLLQRTWIVSDACGNSSSGVQLIRITDLLKPTLQCPPPATVSCEASVSPDATGYATASDNCTPQGDIVITYSDDISGLFGCNGTGIRRRTWQATDNCGNTSSCVQLIWVVDDTDPVINCPANIEISCSDPKDPSFTGQATAVDNCTLDVEITYNDTEQLTGCNGTGMILRTWSARDACGNVQTCTQLITVTDHIAPVLSCPRDTMLDCGFYINPDVLGYPTGTDNCTPSEDLVLAYQDDLSGLTGCTNTGVILRTWFMTDACGNTGSCIQRITIADTLKPVINCPADVVIGCHDSTLPSSLGKATATDYCTASLFIKITYEDDLSQAGQCNGSGFIFRTWTAEDQCGNKATCIQTIEIADHTAPEIQCPASFQISCEADRSPAAQGTARATDNCTPIADIQINWTDDVSGLNGCNGTGNLLRTWTATDACGNKATCVQVLTIIDTKKPVLTPPANITVSCEAGIDVSVTGNLQAADNCTPGAQLDIQMTDDMTGVTGCNHTGTVKRTWVVTDACGNSASATQQIRIVDTTRPVITCGATLTVNCGDPVDPSALGFPEISDNCTAPADMDLLHFDNTAGLVGCNGTGTIYRTWVVYDDCGNSNSCIQNIEVVDQTGPELTVPPAITISCEYANDLDELGRATATDACTPESDIVITYKDNDQGLVFCNGTGQRIRTWKATDLCGNVTARDQLIQFIDTLAPIFYTPFDVVIDCGDDPVDLDLTGEVDVYTDNCASVLSIDIAWHDDFSQIEDCDGSPVIHRIWTLTDPCGNAASSVQRIKIQNYSMGSVVFPDDVQIPCDANMADLSLTGNAFVPENACAYLMESLTYEDLGPVAPYQYARKWTCTDYCGHVQVDTQMIYLIDEVKPVLEVHDMGISFAASEQVTIGLDDIMAEVSDNCDGQVELAMSQTEFSCEDFLDSPQEIVTVTATDDQGNVTTAQVAINLEGGLFLMDCPSDIVVQLEAGECTAGVTYPIAPQGLCNQVPTVTQVDGTGLTSGDAFPIGKTPQVYQITDPLGYTMECAFYVEVLEFPETNVLTCNDTLHVSVAEACEAVITADMLLEGDNYGCWDQYIITFSDPSIPFVNGVLYGAPYLGQYLEACITDPETGNFCCSQLLIEDKLPPQLVCSDITLDCTDDISPEAIPHYPVPQGSVVTPLGNRKYLTTGIDNCGATEIRYTDTEEIHMCDGDYSRIVTRTWIAVDQSGRRDTCQEKLFLRRGTIDQFVFPADTTIYCGNECLRPDGTPDPLCIGGIEGPFCGQFFKGYSDKVIGYCGGSYSVKREWTLVDWCSGQIINDVQIINVEDNVPPVINCEDIISAPSGFGDCGATVQVFPPEATDECSSYPLTYVLKLNGQVVLPEAGKYFLPPLGIGQYTITWEVRDECGNLATCSSEVDLYDNTPPVAYCDKHTVIAINNQDPMGVALLPATTLDDGSFDNCGPVTFRVRRMTSCIDFDWTTDGFDHQPDGDVDDHDRGLLRGEYVPVSCCDVGQGPVLVELEVMDARGNTNYCMVEVEVQDKQAPLMTCLPDIQVSCQYWFDPASLEDPDNRTFGTMVDGFQYPSSARQPIVINDPNNPNFPQPHTWGLDGYVTDNCNLQMDIRVRVFDDCSGDDLPGNAPDGAVRLVERRFVATDPAGQVSTCTQRIWVINFDPFYINTNNPKDPNDDVVWPADMEVNNCGIPDTVYPVILNDACAQIGINLKERRFDKTEGACVKILRDWTIIDWCQYNTQAGTGIWRYTQVVKITSDANAHFTDCTSDIRVYCTLDPEVTEVVDPAFPTTCFVHLNIEKQIEDICSDVVTYDVKVYPPNSSSGIVAVAPTQVAKNPDGTYDLVMNTAQSPDLGLREYGLEYSNPSIAQQHYKVLWTVWDGCGNVSTCEDRIRLEDCKAPTPVCINGLSTVPMPIGGTVTIWAKDFNASSADNCTPANQLRYSFSGDAYQPSRTFTCDDILALGVQQSIDVWVWDNWNNKNYCTTTIVFTDPSDVCGFGTGGVSGIVTTPGNNTPIANTGVKLMQAGQAFASYTTTSNGQFTFPVVPAGQVFEITVERNDNPKNGVSTLDLLRLQQHLLGKEPLNDPYLLIAADANNTGNVSAVDLIEIRKVILGRTTAFPNNRSWRFVPTAYTFNDPYEPWPFQETVQFTMSPSARVDNFMGVKVGDLNRSAQASFNGVTPRSARSTGLVLDDRAFNAGEEFEVTIGLAEEGRDWRGAQWALSFEGLEVIGVTPLRAGLTEDMWYVAGDQFRIAWTAPSAGEAGQLVAVRVKALEAGRLSDRIQLTEEPMLAEAYDAGSEVYGLELTWRNADASFSPEVQLFGNHPNPWNESTVIPFEVPEAGEAILLFTDANGRQVHQVSREVTAGRHEVTLYNPGWPAGIYYYTLRFGETQLTRKMLILDKR